MLESLLVACLRGYKRLISPLLGPRCRFHPTCSEYALAAIRQHGSLRGCLAAGARLCRCQPLCEGGLDPVPLNFRDCFWWGQNPNPQQIEPVDTPVTPSQIPPGNPPEG